MVYPIGASSFIGSLMLQTAKAAAPSGFAGRGGSRLASGAFERGGVSSVPLPTLEFPAAPPPEKSPGEAVGLVSSAAHYEHGSTHRSQTRDRVLRGTAR